jgi:hypothetical protein
LGTISIPKIVNPKFKKAGAVKIAAIYASRAKNNDFSGHPIHAKKGKRHHVPIKKITKIIARRALFFIPLRYTKKERKKEITKAITEEIV